MVGHGALNHPPLPFPPLFSHPLAKCTNNQHLPSRQLPLNELAKHPTRNICRLIATGVINLVQLSKPPKQGYKMSQDVPILLVSEPRITASPAAQLNSPLSPGWLPPPPSPLSFGRSHPDIFLPLPVAVATVCRTTFPVAAAWSFRPCVENIKMRGGKGRGGWLRAP